MMYFESILSALLLTTCVPAVLGQNAVWGQCGGQGWTGSTACVSGSCCTFSNQWYSQCLPCGSNPTTTQQNPVTTTRAPPTPTTTRVTTAAVTTTQAPNPGTGSAGCGKTPLTGGVKSVMINGRNRQYTIRVPDSYNPNKPYKLVMVYHALGDTMDYIIQRGYYGLLPLENNKANLIFVVPQGINNGWANAGGEDIAFTDAMLKTIQAGLCVDPKRIFATGFSYGAGMSYSVACSRANVFRAVAVLAGMQLSGCAGGNTPIAYLAMHGTSDSVIDISLGRGLRDKFVGLNGCTRQNPPEPARGSGTHIKTNYSGCKPGYPVTWIAFDGNHVANQPDRNGQVWAPTEVNTFFKQF